MNNTVTLTGLDDVNDLLTKVSPRIAKNLLRATVHGVAGEIRKEARDKTPVDEGVMKKAIKSKRRRATPGTIRSDVVVSKAAFYWRFLEYGQGPDGIEHAMFMKSVEKIRPELTRMFVEQFGKKWEAALARAAKRNVG